jgi:hypothetical protein
VKTEQTSSDTPASDGGGGDGDSNTVPIVLGVAALVTALTALILALSNRRRSPT